MENWPNSKIRPEIEEQDRKYKRKARQGQALGAPRVDKKSWSHLRVAKRDWPLQTHNKIVVNRTSIRKPSEDEADGAVANGVLESWRSCVVCSCPRRGRGLWASASFLHLPDHSYPWPSSFLALGSRSALVGAQAARHTAKAVFSRRLSTLSCALMRPLPPCISSQPLDILSFTFNYIMLSIMILPSIATPQLAALMVQKVGPRSHSSGLPRVYFEHIGMPPPRPCFFHSYKLLSSIMHLLCLSILTFVTLVDFLVATARTNVAEAQHTLSMAIRAWNPSMTCKVRPTIRNCTHRRAAAMSAMPFAILRAQTPCSTNMAAMALLCHLTALIPLYSFTLAH